MHPVERFRKLAIKRGLTIGALLDASPDDFDLILLVLRHEFLISKRYSERDVNSLLKLWLQSAGSMLDVDHVELRRWLVDVAILVRDAYGHVYSLAAVPPRLLSLHAAVADVDFSREFADANAQESQKRATRKAAWLTAKTQP